MIPGKRQRLKEAAIHSIRVGKAEDAFTTARHLAEEEPSDAEAFQIQGLALSSLGRVQEATACFEEARRLAPDDVRHTYNLAGHLANHGDLATAKSLVEAALALDPKHADSLQLKRRLAGEAGNSEEVPHLLSWLKGRESAWSKTGLALMAIAALLAIFMLVNFPAAPTPGGQKNDVVLKKDTFSQITVLLYLISTPCTFLWMLVDVVDRRRKFTWLVPITVCGALGFNVLPLALYFFVGRKMEEKY